MSESLAAPEEMTREELADEVAALREQTQSLDDRLGELDRKNALVIASVRALVSNADIEAGEDDDPLLAMREAAGQFSTDLGDLQTAVESHGETLATIADVESEKSSEGEKIGAIVAYADKARGGTSKALVTPKEIAGATGCSKRYAYDLVDKIGGLDDDSSEFDEGQYQWAAVRKSTTVPTANGSETKAKALKIDFDRVQQDSGALNWFNNGTGGEEGE